MNLKPRIVIGYSRPDNPAWANIIAHADQIHAAVLSGPKSGPGPIFLPEYVELCARLKAANIKRFGYLASGYTARPQSALQADIDMWNRYGVDGFFIDETANDQLLIAYYRELIGRINPALGVFLNFGRMPHRAFAYLRASLCISERSQSDVLSETYPAWIREFPPEKFLVIAYDVQRKDATSVASKIFTSGVGFYCLSSAPDGPDGPQYGVETELFIDTPVPVPPVIPPVQPPDENQASLLNQQVARTLEYTETMAGLNAHAEKVMSELKRLRILSSSSLDNATNAQIVAQVQRRLP